MWQPATKDVNVATRRHGRVVRVRAMIGIQNANWGSRLVLALACRGTSYCTAVLVASLSVWFVLASIPTLTITPDNGRGAVTITMLLTVQSNTPLPLFSLPPGYSGPKKKKH